ncbi:putative RNA modification enzyme consisting of a 3-phosphoadenosine 5-phosphosulfate sulfotransferase fused to RNA-binding PUA domain protein [Candidatus Methanomethylophilus alvi Mx1201]|uniref:FAD synthetase n=2 Tax=Methanomethylophilus alvi TaxID=1291540 RepID=A0A3G3IG92_9ARCH|nr:phosphoadenosine phosphosulfate reductase family protein [Methanomethylophilus alvi]AGI85428.1 putative RNA modification enzyme consisting of a 3-phosphoadenosine 5-phosphosulfate sulfotransferase fused to RNA-binding PUA domain protein [Candidatus Methanomethylophilus alvi Mx1201]AYQ54847.1 FAD synthetase [Methanomethylophilus alvi]
MYSYEWDPETHGFILTTKSANYIAYEIRPVYAQELEIAGLNERFSYDKNETRPLMWSQKNYYLVDGEKVAKLNNTQYGVKLSIEYLFEGTMQLNPVDLDRMVQKNAPIMDIIVADTKRRAKELYDKDISRCDIAYIAFSGGKDSLVLLDICNQVFPTSAPVIFSDTDMELPDTYHIWDSIKQLYPEREFIRAVSEKPALVNWQLFGPPSRGLRWCCPVHKSTPAIITLKHKLFKESIKVMAFVGVRRDESYARSLYEDSSDGVKNASQLNRMPILDWGAHEVWLYLYSRHLPINPAYFKGMPRIGCVMCPESSTRYEWFIDKAYPGLLKPYNDIIINTTAKQFKNKDDEQEYLSNLSWQARKSGALLQEYLTNPFEKREGTVSTFQVPNCPKKQFFEWIKTIGDVVFDETTGSTCVRYGHLNQNLIPFKFESTPSNFATIVFTFNSTEEQSELFLPIRTILRKSMSCVGCRTCEAECSQGAISFEDGIVSIDESKCTRCHKCHELDQGCWRFRSMYKPDTEQLKMNSINNYCNFGLREKDQYTWISTLLEMGEDFFPWTEYHPLGSKMVVAASKWFQQSLLIDAKTKKPTLLLEIFRKYGGSSELGWELIWLALANNSLLIKWYVTSTDLGTPYSIDRLSDMLKEYDGSLTTSTIKGGLAAFKDLVTKSPIGDTVPLVLPEMKGKSSVTGVTRLAKPIESLTVLYGLYLIAKATGRSSFSVRELMTADMDSIFVSPIVAFGTPVDEFKKLCEGLRSKYPDYISVTFTYGNDGIEIYPQKHSLDDILQLELEG